MGWALALALLRAVPATVTSAAPEAVAVTVYRNPDRGSGAINLRWLGGRALITETRTVAVPAGESVIRFEGVAAGIIPTSAIVTGLPGGVVEKNRDANLLSPAALADGSLGRHVTLHRTDRATGRVSEEAAIIRSTAEGGMILQTPDGFEALGCSGLPERLVFDGVPSGLSARPTLSVTTRSAAATTAQVQLTYLAEEFDWGANYVVRIAPDGQTLSIFAWLTLANGNGESFDQAETFAVAGRVNQEASDRRDGDGVAAYAPSLHCWPMDGTSTHQSMDPVRYERRTGAARGFALQAPASVAAMDIIVTAAKRAEVSALGDLKLYRIPERVTFAANSQKQVAFLEHDGVPFRRVYRREVAATDTGDPEPAEIRLRFRNDAAHHMGEPLPSGAVALFERSGERLLLSGEGAMHDTALDEDVDLLVGRSPQVRVAQREEEQDRGRVRWQIVEISNANPAPAAVEIEFGVGADERITGENDRLGRKNGRPLWAVTVPANGRATLRYRVESAD